MVIASSGREQSIALNGDQRRPKGALSPLNRAPEYRSYLSESNKQNEPGESPTRFPFFNCRVE